MNLNINQAEPINYTNKQFKNNNYNKDQKFSLELHDKKISDEENKNLYEYYKKSIMIHTAFSFEEFKNNPGLFPPVTAPGIVRKAWREQYEKCTTEKERVNMMCFSSHCIEVLNSKDGSVPNDLNSYLNFLSDMKDYFELHFHNVPGIDNNYYENYINTTNKLEKELKKYE